MRSGAVGARVGLGIVEDDGELSEVGRAIEREGAEVEAAGIAEAVAVGVFHAADVRVRAAARDRGKRVVAIGDAVTVPVVRGERGFERIGQYIFVRVVRMEL